jgi:hypothetical protein
LATAHTFTAGEIAVDFDLGGGFTLVPSGPYQGSTQGIGYPGLGYVPILSTGLTSTTVEFAYTGTAISCSSSCGYFDDVSAFVGPQTQNQPAISGHGTVYWPLCNDSTTGGYGLYCSAPNFSTTYGNFPNGTPTAPVYFVIGEFSNDMYAGESPATIEGYLTTMLEDCHAKDWYCFVTTQNALKNAATAAAVNSWIRQQNETAANKITGNYVDWQIDIGSRWPSFGNDWAGNGSIYPTGAVQWAQYMNTAIGNNIPIENTSPANQLDLGDNAPYLYVAGGGSGIIAGYGIVLNTDNQLVFGVGNIGGTDHITLPEYAPTVSGGDTCLHIPYQINSNLDGIVYGTGQPCAGSTNAFTMTNQHTVASGAPTLAAGTGAGTSPTVSISGNDEDGYVVITPGTSPAASATVATITMANACPAGITPVLQPANAATSALSGAGKVYAFGDTTTAWEIDSGSTALTAGTQYLWGFHAGCSQGPPLSVTQIASVAATGTSQTSITSPSAVVPANSGVIVICGNGDSTNPTVTSSIAETWTKGPSNYRCCNNLVGSSYANFTAGGSSTFTCTSATSVPNWSMIVLAVPGTVAFDSGSEVGSSIDQAAGTISTNTFTTASSNELGMMCTTGANFNNVYTPGAVATIPAQMVGFDNTGSSSMMACEAAKLPSPVTSQTATMVTNSGYNASVFFGFTY